ncbi:MAG TPA: phosphate ABC transporter substrate-binding protein PstS [Candidatus Dormibacteraeota bacterium]
MRTALLGGIAVLGTIAVVACGSNSTNQAASQSGTPKPVSTGNPTSAVTLSESGSSLLLPFLQELVAPLTAAYPNITLTPSGGGSGKGISDAIAGNSVMGGTDAYLSPAQFQQNPSIANIPIAVSAQGIWVNVPGVSSLRLSGDVIAKIYQGSITKWNDPAIAALNSGVTLPSTTIMPLVRQGSSGDTFLFTSFLSATSSAWSNGPGAGTSVTWPKVATEGSASSNPGMVAACKAGCIAYIGVSASAAATTAGLLEAQIENKSGAFVTPTPTTIAAAVNAGAFAIPANLALSLIYQSGAQSYPIVNFEYVAVNTTQPSADAALALRTFLAWAIDPNGGSQASFLSAENFIGLKASVPPTVLNAIVAKIDSISS